MSAMEDDMIGLFKKRWWIGPMVAGLAIAAVASVQAAIPDVSGVIHACYTSRGALRVVNNAADCKNNETVLPGVRKGLRAFLDLRANRVQPDRQDQQALAATK